VAPSASDASVLAVSRVTAIVAGALGTALAIVSPSVIGALSIFYTLLSVCLFVPMLAGLFVPRAGAREALWAMTAGVSSVLAVQWATSGQGLGRLTPPVIGLLAAALAFLAVFTLRGLGSAPAPASKSGSR
jgi:Na+/proline symporter